MNNKNIKLWITREIPEIVEVWATEVSWIQMFLKTKMHSDAYIYYWLI